MQTSQGAKIAKVTYSSLLSDGYTGFMAMHAGEIACNSADALALSIYMGEYYPMLEGHWDEIPMFDRTHSGVWYT